MKRWPLLLMAASSLYAQSGVITGSAFDAKHTPIAGVKVSLRRVGQTEVLIAETDSKGVYRVRVTPGQYTVHAESKDGGEANAGPLAIDKALTLDLILQPSFFDEPKFTVAGVTDNTYRGGHGADTALRSSEALTKATAALSQPHADDHPVDTVRALQKAAESDPSEVNLFNWGTELLSHRAPQPASGVFNKGMRLFPASKRMLLGLATAYYAAGSYEQAARCFFEASDINPSDPTPYLFLSKIQAREITESGGYKDRFARFAELHPENATANYDYAAVLLKEHDPAALPLLKKTIQLDPHFGAAYLQLGILEAAQQKYPEAIAAYQKAILESPGLEESHYRLSEIYRILGDHATSEKELAIYRDLSKQSSDKLERERREMQQFVVNLKN